VSDLVPECLTYDDRCTFHGVPGVHHDLDDYPMFWTVKVRGRVWDDDDEGDGREVTVGETELYIVPDAGIIDVFVTLDAVNQEGAHFGVMLTVNRPDLIDEMSLGGDLLILSWLKVLPRLRGNKLRHSILKAVLSSIGTSSKPLPH
jgi:hypothetical protein